MDNDAANRTSRIDAESDDFRLEPIVRLPETVKLPAAAPQTRRVSPKPAAKTARYRKNPHAALYATDRQESRQEPLLTTTPAEDDATASSLTPPSERDYTSVQLLQRYLRLGGYTVAMGFAMFLGVRFLQIVWFAGDGPASRFASFLVYTFWTALGTTFLSGTFLAAAEFLQLMMDIQSNFQAAAQAGFQVQSTPRDKSRFEKGSASTALSSDA